MRKFLMMIPLAATLGFAGCTSTGGIDTGQIAAYEQQVQQIAVSICGFLPTAATVLNIFVGNPALGTAEAIAQAICNAVTPSAQLQARKRATMPNVGGVPVHGRFVGR